MLQKKPTIPPLSVRYGRFSAVLTLLIFLSCSSHQFSNDEHLVRIEFGHGGGFAGIEYAYILFDDGRVFTQGSESEFLMKLPRHQTKQLFNNMKGIFDKNKAVNNPGNTYQFIKLVNRDNHPRWVWNSSNQATLDAQLKINYSILMKLVIKNERSENQ